MGKIVAYFVAAIAMAYFVYAFVVTKDSPATFLSGGELFSFQFGVPLLIVIVALIFAVGIL